VSALFVAAAPYIATALAVATLIVIIGTFVYKVFFFDGPLITTRIMPIATGSSSGGEYGITPADIILPGEEGYPASFPRDGWPVSTSCSSVTQCPFENTSHQSSNALDFGLGSCLDKDMGIYSPIDGTITEMVIRYDSTYNTGLGNYIKVEFVANGRTFTLIFGHLANTTLPGIRTDDPSTEANEGAVAARQQIAVGGNTGHTIPDDAYHLHIELYANDGGKVPCITDLISEPGTGCSCN
jgi:hypothetical protein